MHSLTFHVASDLHLEMLHGSTLSGCSGVPLHRDADLLLLAGDIGRPEEVLRLFNDWPTPVLYVLGNHEFYGREMNATRELIRRMAVGTSVILLDSDEVGPEQFARFETWYAPRREKLEQIRFIGATLWTDYAYPSSSACENHIALRMNEAGRQLRDHRAISYGNKRFTPSDALAEHTLALNWLRQRVVRPFGGKTVVMTHHGPSAKSVHPRYRGSPLNAAFVSDLSADILSRVDLWIHGHVHDSFDYHVNGCRVVANPRGYSRPASATEEAKVLHYENSSFDASLLITI